ncbi:MAG: hypothetical protein LBS52_04445 [Dysgonamonadaceae bacterium]|jgi:hypothetical protein|nr:hypothetical protein [Dysgonamonadaceae bacterium]
MNNSFFSPSRFARLAAYDLKTKYKTYLIAVVAAFVGFTIINYLFLDADEAEIVSRTLNHLTYSHSLASFTVCLTAFFVCAGFSFPALSSKKSAMGYILLPASTFEKYLLEFLIKIVIAFGVFLLVYYLAANLSASIAEPIFNNRNADFLELKHARIDLQPFTFRFVYKNTYITTVQSGSAYVDTIDKVSVMGTFFVGSILLFLFNIRLFFKRFSLIKTVIAGFFVYYLFFQLMSLLGIAFTGDKNTAYDFKFFYPYYDYLFIFTIITLIVLGYYKLKEKRL